MLSQMQRATILELHAQKIPKREIARAEKATPYRSQILELLASCQGNLVRVHEELLAGGAELSYQALTAFCRREGIGHEPIVAAGSYDHLVAPGVESDTPREAGGLMSWAASKAVGPLV